MLEQTIRTVPESRFSGMQRTCLTRYEHRHTGLEVCECVEGTCVATATDLEHGRAERGLDDAH